MFEVVIIGGGIAGLAAAYRVQRAAGNDEAPRFRLIESSPRWGGKIRSERLDEFLVEGGPDSFVPHKPQALDLVRELGLGERLLPTNDSRRGVSVVHHGRLVRLPERDGSSRGGPWLRSPLLSWRGKLRALAELLVPARSDGGDESVADFIRRRLGNEVLENLAEPLLAHIHVADIERMSLRATYPRLAELERRHGGLLRGMWASRRPAAGLAEGPLFWSLRGGLEELVEALVARLEPETLIKGRRVVCLGRDEAGKYRIELDDGEVLTASAVVLAVPAFQAAGMLRELDPDLALSLGELRYASVATLSLGYRAADLEHAPDSFGFFVPRREGLRVLACTWTSAKFCHRAPEGSELLRVFLGGSCGGKDLALDDEELIHAVRGELGEILGIRATPVLTRLVRWEKGYPQYDVGHLERLEEIEERLPTGLFLAGSAFHGVGLPDCIKSGTRAAEQIRQHLIPSRG